MNKQSLLLNNEIFSILGELSNSIGFNRLIGQIYGLVYFSDEPVSVQEITRILKTSKGNISVNIRELERLGAIRRIHINGSRKTYFQPEKDFISIAKTHFGLAIKKRMKLGDEFLSKMEENIKTEKNKKYEQKYTEIKKIYNQISDLINTIFS